MKKKLKNVKFRYEHFQSGKLMKAAIFVGKRFWERIKLCHLLTLQERELNQ